MGNYRFHHPLPVGTVIRHHAHRWTGAWRGTAKITGVNPQNVGKNWFEYDVAPLPHVSHEIIGPWHSTHIKVPDTHVNGCEHHVEYFEKDRDYIPYCSECRVLLCQWSRQTGGGYLNPPEYADPCLEPGIEWNGAERLCPDHLRAEKEEAERDAQMAAYEAEMAEVRDEVLHGDPLHRGLADDPDLPLY